MRSYRTLITIHGLRLASAASFAPIREGEVIGLSDKDARGLLRTGAIERSDIEADYEATSEPAGVTEPIQPTDREKLISALKALGVETMPIIPEPMSVELIGPQLVDASDAELLAEVARRGLQVEPGSATEDTAAAADSEAAAPKRKRKAAPASDEAPPADAAPAEAGTGESQSAETA